jgi:hypothetical protein
MAEGRRERQRAEGRRERQRAEGRRKKAEGRRKKAEGRRKKAEGRDCNFFSATVSVAFLNRRQSSIETIAPTQNYGHILLRVVSAVRSVLTHRATAITTCG